MIGMRELWRNFGGSMLVVMTLAVVTLAIWWSGRINGEARVMAKWDAERLRQVVEVQQSTERARQVEHQAAKSIQASRERTDAQIADLNRRHRIAVERMRQQATGGVNNMSQTTAAESSNCAGTPVPPGDGVVVVADQQADARWLLDFARDADITRLALAACMEQSRD